jgi:hypothetical protein
VAQWDCDVPWKLKLAAVQLDLGTLPPLPVHGNGNTPPVGIPKVLMTSGPIMGDAAGWG